MRAPLQLMMLFILMCGILPAQFEPDTAQVDLYFPHLADGGNQSQTWQTSFNFTNPNSNFTATCILSIFGDNGSPLALDLGSGSVSRVTFTIAHNGRKIFRSLMVSRTTVTGWAIASCNLPVQGTVLFRQIANGAPQVEISAPATLPTSLYRSMANRSVGIALVNIYNTPLTLHVKAFDADGNSMGNRDVTVCASCHTAFNLSSFPSNFPRDFDGAILISSDRPSSVFSAWTLNSERGLLSSLPAGGMIWPGSHYDRINQIYFKLLWAITSVFPTVDVSVIRLDIPTARVINASATPADNTIHINLALAELISDSQSELANVIGHELGHLIQAKLRAFLINPNPEQDADAIGMILALSAGYDPYAGAGAMGKLLMISGRTDLFSQVFDDLNDPHTSFTTRMGVLFATLQLACASSPAVQTLCSQYKDYFHPSFPPSLPLTKTPVKPTDF